MSVVLLGSTSGSVTLQEPAVAGSTTINLPATSGTMAVLPTATSVLPEASGGTGTTTGYYGFKNRIINGAMVIDQRNAGASVTVGISQVYTVDRWYGGKTGTVNSFTVQRSTTAPTGFTNSILITAGTGVTPTTNDFMFLSQAIEGFNFADLAWGTASASAVSLSFWVRSSLTGNFGVGLRNGAANRSYIASYTISAANTWEQKTITIPGDTSGTWATDNTQACGVFFDLGEGSAFSSTAGSWSSANLLGGLTGGVKLGATTGATLNLTGVQLEKGSTATSFDYRPYGTELALCQRYYFNLIGSGTANFKALGLGLYYSNTQLQIGVPFPVTMRTTPTSVSASAADSYVIYRNSGSDTFTGWTDSSSTVNFGDLYATSGVSGTAGQSGTVGTNSASSFLAFNAEL
jgi:hypothetical protein